MKSNLIQLQFFWYVLVRMRETCFAGCGEEAVWQKK